jgi:hypothetical protein
MVSPVLPRSQAWVHDWSRQAPAAWEQRLQEVIPSESGPSWLMLRWEPGDPWRPINRWVLWHVRPRHVTAERYPDHLAELDGPAPRSSGHACFPGWCECPKTGVPHANRWVNLEPDAPVMIDHWQWKLYHETGGRDGGLFGTRWWVVQGEDGGHRYSLTSTERKLYQLQTGQSDVPVIGSLPYAPFDERAVTAILVYDRVRRGVERVLDAQHAAKLVGQDRRAEREALVAAAGQAYDREIDRLAESAGELARRFTAMESYHRGPVMTKQDKAQIEAQYDADVMKAESVALMLSH